jgi:hypothetical protein
LHDRGYYRSVNEIKNIDDLLSNDDRQQEFIKVVDKQGKTEIVQNTKRIKFNKFDRSNKDADDSKPKMKPLIESNFSSI